MLSSSNFWTPVLLSALITGLGVVWVVMMALAGGAHAKPASSTPALSTIFFPFADLLDGVSFPLAAMAFLVQYPIYGAVAGYGNYHEKLKSHLLAIAIVHILVTLLATFATR